jgi:hypothetical protein
MPYWICPVFTNSSVSCLKTPVACFRQNGHVRAPQARYRFEADDRIRRQVRTWRIPLRCRRGSPLHRDEHDDNQRTDCYDIDDELTNFVELHLQPSLIGVVDVALYFRDGFAGFDQSICVLRRQDANRARFSMVGLKAIQ